ncbi:uncharacterized protein LOC143356711 [Halictus rubicundus]|uniref:uncharacterized protein LOC143356711 n=1 Tax=Halictus rubicundus TaxID=77578 RepID=UPI00403526B4
MIYLFYTGRIPDPEFECRGRWWFTECHWAVARQPAAIIGPEVLRHTGQGIGLPSIRFRRGLHGTRGGGRRRPGPEGDTRFECTSGKTRSSGLLKACQRSGKEEATRSTCTLDKRRATVRRDDDDDDDGLREERRRASERARERPD